ncbi:Outer membrane lipoprotein-sorting protein [Natronincola peptidivorans]|uniref:Outer membrane lipoprotein-sorting protein n=1 Tax=Natronincola peptidivorans TaxID=426128 RepID=A0A1I0BHB7_9FIRM|nr:outer membrane lipoprotein carrier protein LolA [Natronincola peptidivorans]SET06289.1 Outer membrane lipoprotein-sorting protein [Natronincola peptidivorans]
MKVWKVVILIGILSILSACQQPTDEEIYYKIQQKLSTMESYQCTAKIYANHEDEETEYIFLQAFKVPNQYRLEVISPEGLKGNLTIYNGRTAWLQHPSINQIWKIDDFHQSQEQLMFIGYFLRNYISSKEADFETEIIEDKEYLVMNTKIPGGNYYFDHQKLWVEKKQLVPTKLYIFDEKGNARFKVYYEDFLYNPKLQETLFHLSMEEE